MESTGRDVVGAVGDDGSTRTGTCCPILHKMYRQDPFRLPYSLSIGQISESFLLFFAMNECKTIIYTQTNGVSPFAVTELREILKVEFLKRQLDLL